MFTVVPYAAAITFIYRRHLEKELSDTKQEKLFLELKIESLQKEVETFKDSTHQQRLRALDLKYELREVRYNTRFLEYNDFTVLWNHCLKHKKSP